MITKSVPPAVVREIAFRLRRWYRSLAPGAVSETFRFQDYHGFLKDRIPRPVLDRLLEGLLGPRYAPEGVQAEHVRVAGDLTHAIHSHHYAYAFVIILGRAEHFPDPAGAFGYRGDAWRKLTAGEVIDIPPRTAHGFSVIPGGQLDFLSVQSPPIQQPDGFDDYQPHRRVPLPTEFAA